MNRARSIGVRAARRGWAARTQVVLTARDHRLLYAMGLCGVLPTRAIARLEDMSLAVARDRLRKLFCAGYCQAFVPDLAHDNCYALTLKGRAVVVDALELDPGELRITGALPKRLDHHLAITEMRINLAVAARRSGRYELASFRSDHDLAGPRYRSGAELVPDALVELDDRESGSRLAFALECDLGTESVRTDVVRKLSTYARYAAARVPLYSVLDPLVLFITESTRRARNVACALVAAGLDARVALGVRRMLDTSNVLGARYAVPNELAGSPLDAAAACFIRRLVPGT